MENEYEKLNSEQLFNIIQITTQDAGEEIVIDHEEFLSECLNKQIVLEKCQDKAFNGVNQLLQKSYILAGEKKMSELIFGHESLMQDLQRCKSFLKKKIDIESQTLKKDVYIVLYYAIISSTLLKFNKLITKHSVKEVKKYLLVLQDKKWLTSELKEMFGEALVCLRKMQSSETW